MQVNLKDIRLSEFTFNNLELLKQLHGEHFNHKSSICTERAKYITEYLKYKDNNEDPPIIRRAKSINYFLSNKEPIICDNNLLAGTKIGRAHV